MLVTIFYSIFFGCFERRIPCSQQVPLPFKPQVPTSRLFSFFFLAPLGDSPQSSNSELLHFRIKEMPHRSGSWYLSLSLSFNGYYCVERLATKSDIENIRWIIGREPPFPTHKMAFQNSEDTPSFRFRKQSARKVWKNVHWSSRLRGTIFRRRTALGVAPVKARLVPSDFSSGLVAAQ